MVNKGASQARGSIENLKELEEVLGKSLLEILSGFCNFLWVKLFSGGALNFNNYSTNWTLCVRYKSVLDWKRVEKDGKNCSPLNKNSNNSSITPQLLEFKDFGKFVSILLFTSIFIRF